MSLNFWLDYDEEAFRKMKLSTLNKLPIEDDMKENIFEGICRLRLDESHLVYPKVKVKKEGSVILKQASTEKKHSSVPKAVVRKLAKVPEAKKVARKVVKVKKVINQKRPSAQFSNSNSPKKPLKVFWFFVNKKI